MQPTETLNDIRLTLADSPEGYWLGSYCFTRADKGGKGQRVGEWTELKEVFDGIDREQRSLQITYAPFNEAEARGHIQRLRDLLTGGVHDSVSAAIDSGISVQDAVRNPHLWTKEAAGYAAAQAAAANKAKGNKKPAVDLAEEAAKVPFDDWTGWNESPITQLIPPQARPARAFPTCLRSISISPWSPPPQHLRARGHLFYLQFTTLEGESIHLTASTKGFYVNKSTSSRFDPSQRDQHVSNSIFDLLCGYSQQFLVNFSKIFNDPLSARDFFAVLPMNNCVPAAPWLARTHNHAYDPLRPQTAYLLTGTTSPDSLEGTRDWNEEIQSARELPRASLPERHVRERALQRLFSEFAKSAASAVPKVAAGEVQALNPMDKLEAQMYCINNLFISRGIDGVDIYPYLGGDEAAHVAVSKDVQGVRMLNTVDVDGLCLLGTVIVDWHGERWVAQSIIPGLFRRKVDDDEEEMPSDKDAGASDGKAISKPDAEAEQATTPPAARESDKPSPAEDTQVVYGGVEGPEVIRTDAGFAKVFERVAKALHLSQHSIKDAKSQEHSLWLSVDSKGLQGADGRRYALDIARLTPVDVEWIEADMKGSSLGNSGDAPEYPHEMVLLRPELIEIYWDSEFRKWAREQLAQRQKSKEGEMDKKAVENGEEGDKAKKADEVDGASGDDAAQPTLDGSAFQLAFNPDAFVKFKPPTDESMTPTPMVTDESDPSVAAVRAASKYLRESAIPRLVTDIASGIATAADGQALTRQMHARGINVRYLGHLAHLAEPAQHDKLDHEALERTGNGRGFEVLLKILRDVAIQEMVVRATKRVFNGLLKGTAVADGPGCVSHFLNCLVGGNSSPVADYTQSPFESETPQWTQLTQQSLREKVAFEVRRRYRFSLPDSYLSKDVRKPQLLREFCIRSGVQLKLRDYDFKAASAGQVNGHAASDADSGADTAAPAAASKGSASNKKKKAGAPKKGTSASPATNGFVERHTSSQSTFQSEDVLNMVPVVKDSAPTSKVAEDAFETGRITLMSRGDRELGVDLLLEGISFHETIYGMAHPETARCYALFAAIVHQLSTLIAAETNAKIREEQEKQGKEDVQVELPAYAENLSSATALRYQRQAVTISERALGLDHAETMAQWASLAILERAEGNLEESLRCERRVMELQDIVYGQRHPENITALSNLATTLQSARKYDVSLKVFTSAHQLCLDLFGSESVTTANMAFELCQAQSLVGDLRTALETLKESVRIFENTLGKEHAHTKEASSFLSKLAAAAVRAAKMEQSQRIREASNSLQSRMRSLGGGSSNVGTSGASRVAASASAAAGRRTSVNGVGAANGQINGSNGNASSSRPSRADAVPSPDLSVDELVRYISGAGAGAGAKSGASAARKGKNKAPTSSARATGAN